ncbi:hypothetical protein [Thalassotalea agarivorans]|uniref:DUF2306 domain-containing protein n=1 Tax=Thalassotalea agarivorans TaxID=349064 RepID=A0A1I0CBN1_THASX|nr:hypothetical protein [Thalassotalea agarivorans]SET16844.1 hypothetical protein SAMN05660429_01136 [Thalassotalea agarivorans]
MFDQMGHFEPITYIAHAVVGLLSLFAALVAMSVVKGGSHHRKFGWFFVAAIAVTSATAYFFFYQRPTGPFEVLGATLALYFVSSAILSFKRYDKVRKASHIFFAVILILVVIGLAALLKQNFQIPVRVFVLVTHIVLVVSLLVADLRFAFAEQVSQQKRVSRHFYRMFLTFGLALASAIGNIMNIPVPMCVAVSFIVMTCVHYLVVKSRFKSDMAVA